MTQARLSITLPEGVWIRAVSTEHPDADFRVLAVMPGEDAGFGLVRIAGPEIHSILAGMEAAEDLTSVSMLRRKEEQALVQFETTQPLLLRPLQASRMPIEPPVEIQDGVASLELTASHDHLSALGEQLGEFDLDFEVEYIHDRIGFEALLSDRQYEFLFAAVECGYYDTPRECSLTELADELGVAKSTASETLHRAEGTVITRFVREQSDRRSPSQ